LPFPIENEKFAFPVEVLVALPLTIVVAVLGGSVDRKIAFQFYYQIIPSSFGILIPLQIIVKNKKMIEKLKSIFYLPPLLLKVVEKLKRTKSSSVSPDNIQVDC
jgi:hypothetical protein